jgi:hypothetical protein
MHGKRFKLTTTSAFYSPSASPLGGSITRHEVWRDDNEQDNLPKVHVFFLPSLPLVLCVQTLPLSPRTLFSLTCDK